MWQPLTNVVNTVNSVKCANDKNCSKDFIQSSLGHLRSPTPPTANQFNSIPSKLIIINSGVYVRNKTRVHLADNEIVIKSDESINHQWTKK